MIRLGGPADYRAIAAVYRRASLSNDGDRDNLLSHPEHLILGREGLREGRTLVSEEHGEVHGFASWVETESTVDLADLFVDPAWMRRGIATALIAGICDVLRARGAPRLEVTANPHALDFYRAVGFEDIGNEMTEFGSAPRMALIIAERPG